MRPVSGTIGRGANVYKLKITLWAIGKVFCPHQERLLQQKSCCVGSCSRDGDGAATSLSKPQAVGEFLSFELRIFKHCLKTDTLVFAFTVNSEAWRTSVIKSHMEVVFQQTPSQGLQARL